VLPAVCTGTLYKRMGGQFGVQLELSGTIGGILSSSGSLAILTAMRRAGHGAPIAKVYFCPFHPEHGLGEYKRDSSFRKPGPGMILQAQTEFDIDLKRSVLVGDRVTDIRAGAAAGVGCNLLYRARLESGEAETSMAATATIEKLADVIPFLDAQVAEVASASCIS